MTHILDCRHSFASRALALGESLAVIAMLQTGAEVTSGPDANGAWDEGETVSAAVRFSAPVTVTGPPGSTPTLAILLDGARRAAAFAGGSGTDTLTFSHTVSAADAGARKARVAPNGLALNGAGGGAVETAFAVAPWVSAAALAPDASGDNVWTPGESVEVRLTFSEAVAVASVPGERPGDRAAVPSVQVTIAGVAADLDYSSGSGSATLVFAAVLPAAVLDDSHDEDEETFTLTLSAPSGGNAWLSDATATGTIENSDAMPRQTLEKSVDVAGVAQKQREGSAGPDIGKGRDDRASSSEEREMAVPERGRGAERDLGL